VEVLLPTFGSTGNLCLNFNQILLDASHKAEVRLSAIPLVDGPIITCLRRGLIACCQVRVFGYNTACKERKALSEANGRCTDCHRTCHTSTELYYISQVPEMPSDSVSRPVAPE
jgi:hypothetical protein